jgi:UDP-N-acetylglucosamine 2-epimerase (non-hydrolysing)
VLYASIKEKLKVHPSWYSKRLSQIKGVTEETTVMGVPCMTLRTTTERPETVAIGTNELLGIDPAALKPALDRLFAGQWKKGAIPPLWDGKSGQRIVEVLERNILAV